MTVNHAWMIKGWLLGQTNVPEEIIAAVNTVIASFEQREQPKEVVKTATASDSKHLARDIIQQADNESEPEDLAIGNNTKYSQKPRNPENIWNDWQISKLVEMKADGATASDIAEVVGKTTTQVHNKWALHKAKISKGSTSLGEAQAPSMGGA